MDIKEEGEISLDDVSSSEETNHNNWLKKEKKLDMDRKHDKRVEVDILPQDAAYGKENRQYSNELHTQDIKTKPPILDDLIKDGLLPISSDENDGFELVGLPGSSERQIIPLGPKRKKKKKKKKKTGQRTLVLDDLESKIEVASFPTRITGDDIVQPQSHYDPSELVHKKYSPPSSKLYRPAVNNFRTISHHPRSPSPRRRSPRRLSPGRTTVISESRYPQYKSQFRDHLSRRDENYSLLKKVRQFDNKYKETSLKDKLFNKAHVLKLDSDNYPKENGYLENHREINYDLDEEEDVDKLRRAALETKLQKSERKDVEIIKDTKAESEDNSSLNYNAGDQDEEDLELRMIALRSAFQKKHRDRVQRGITGKNKNFDRRDKSPSSDSFLDDLFNDFKELGKESTDGVEGEDMDLDSDVEREKANQPYSPTDDLSDDKYSDTDTFKSTDRVTINSYPTVPRTEFNAPVPIYSQEYYPQPNRMVHPETPYPPSNPTQPSAIDRYLGTDQFNYNASYIRSMPPRIGAISTSSRAETPYSPTDTPVFDPELPVCPSELSLTNNVTNATSVPYPSNSYLDKSMLRPYNNGPNYIPPPVELNKPTASSTASHFTRDPRRAAALSRGVIPVPIQPQKTTPIEQPSVKPVETPKEVVSADPRIHGIFAASKNKNDDRFEEIMKSLEEYTSEPAYLQGVPQVTKDTNKIPTLVNRTLVPAPILRTNKQLQQKLPAKKLGDTVEKTFKNAEMQPVEIVNQSKSSSTFKPIKLPSKMRKIQLIDLPVKGFNPINNSSTSADITLENSGAVDLSKNAEILTTEAEVKKRGRRPKTPTIKKTSAKKSPVKDNSKASTKNTGRKSKENNKEIENLLDEREKVDEGEVKRPRGRPRSRSVQRVDTNEEENKKRESIHRAVKGKILKVSETSSKENDKKRRSSADEDEEALRASLIASMYTSGLKKTKQVDDSTDKTKIDNTKDKSLTTSSILYEQSTTSTLKNNSTLINNVNSSFVNNKGPTTKNTIGHASSNTLVNARKRPGMADVFGPPEKILKKATVTSKNLLDNLTKNLAAPASPKMSKNVSRVVINLGEDSDSDSDISDYSPPVPMTRSNLDFGKKVDEFLKSQREKLEVNSKGASMPTGNKTATSIVQKTSALGSTPLAVRHLPVSKQEEYRRLKQQLAEKEKQKLIRASEKSSQKPTKATSKSAGESAQVTATNLQVKKTTRGSKSATASSISTSPPSISSAKSNISPTTLLSTEENRSNGQELFTNIPIPSRISSFTPASENLQPFTNIYPNNLMDILPTEEQQILLPLDFSIKPDPDNCFTNVEESKVDPAIIQSVSENCYDEINYDMPLECLEMRENLIIQISNVQGDNTTTHRKVLFAKDFISTEEITPTPTEETTPSTPAAPVLKILTTAQLNMKIAQEPPSTNQEESEEKVKLDENGQVITQNTQLPTENTIENNNSADDLTTISQVAPVVPKSEPVTDSSEQHMSIPSIQVTPVTESSASTLNEPVQVNVNTEESALLLPPKKEPEVESPTQTEPVPVPSLTDIKSEIQDNLETYSKLSIEEQKTELSKIENDLVKKRYNILSDVTEMIESLQQWEIEQNAKMKLTGDVARLQLELKMAEERLEEQEFKVNNIGPKIKKVHSTINSGRSECAKLSQLCQGLGANVSGNEYKIPITGADAMYDKLRDIANYTQQLFKKKEAYNNKNKNNIGLKPPTAHKNDTGIFSNNEQQSAPLNLSVHPTPEVNENLSTVKTEESENQDLNSASITTLTSIADFTPVANSASIINSSLVTDSTAVINSTSIINSSSVADSTPVADSTSIINSSSIADSTPVANSASIINSSSVTDSTSINSSTSNDNLTPPVQPDLSVNINENQVTSDEFSLTKVKSEPVDVNETEGFESSPMEVDNESETIKDTQSTHVTEPITQIKTEKPDDVEMNESISIFNNTALKEEKNDTQPEESCENISNSNISIRVIPSERLTGQIEEEKTKKINVETTDEQTINSVGVNDKTVELSYNVDPDLCKKETPEFEMRLENDQIQNTEMKFVSDVLSVSGLNDGYTQNTEIKSEVDSLLSNAQMPEGNNMNIVGQSSKRSAEAVVTNTQETWVDFEEEKPPVTGLSYESVLAAFNTTRPVDPNGVLCPYELMGTCKDDSCVYNHLDADRKT